MIDGFMTAEEIKPLLGIKARCGDNRTLNKYVIEGKIEIKHLSKKIKLYRLPQQEASKNGTIDNEEWVFC